MFNMSVPHPTLYVSNRKQEKLTFLDFVAEQVDLLSSGHAAGGPIHPHDLQVGGVRSLWGRKEKQLLSEIYLPEASSRATHLQRGVFLFAPSL